MNARKINLDCNKKKEDTDLIKKELDNAKRIAKYGHDHFDDDSHNSKLYLEKFISKGLRDISGKYIINQLRDNYQHGSDMLGDSAKHTVKVTCDNNTPKCQAKYFAHMSETKDDIEKKTSSMNICDAWFDIAGTPAGTLPNAKKLESTEDILKECKKKKDDSRYKTIEDFWFGKGMSSKFSPC